MTQRGLFGLAGSGFRNPYRPGAGHMPPHLAGREREYAEFDQLLRQDTIFENMVLTGQRGVGKTVLLDTFKPRATVQGWRWVGADLSESASVSEETLARRLLTDLAVVTSSVAVRMSGELRYGFAQDGPEDIDVSLSYTVLAGVYEDQPGLVSDKLKAVLEFVWRAMSSSGDARAVFAYDEAQNLSDNAARDEYPLSMLLDVFYSLQKKGVPFLLVLTGLPTLFPKLVEARTYAERMFRVVTLGKLTAEESREAIVRPVEVADCPVRFSEDSVRTICTESGGYPYFIQFICREVFDLFIQQLGSGQSPVVPIDAIQRKLDTDFFAGRWAKATDRQRQLLWVIANLQRPDEEFTIQELVATGQRLPTKAFSSSHANQMLASLAEQGLIYKNRFGRYSFAVPLLGRFILRTYGPPSED
jgi:hypothetical protein